MEVSRWQQPIQLTPNSKVVKHIQEAANEMALAVTTWHELLFDVLRMPDSQRRTALEQYLLDTIRPEIPILPYDAEVAAWFAQERARLSKSGLPPSYPDGHIAAVAAVNGLILVTCNVADFAEYSDLKIENWFD